MKIGIIGLLLLVLIYSCKKSKSDSDKEVSSVAVSVHTADPVLNQYLIDSFVRDQNKRLVKFIRVTFDSTPQPVTSHTTEYIFNYTGNDSLPGSFTVNANLTDHHKLQYDGAGRLIMDSSMTFGVTFYYSYLSSAIRIYQGLHPTIGYNIDTMRMDNGNITGRSYWVFAPTYAQHDNYSYTYTSYLNPLSFPGNLGLLFLQVSGRRDFLSKNLLNQSMHNSSVDKQLTWNTDQYGRVIRGEETILSSGYKRVIVYKYE